MLYLIKRGARPSHYHESLLWHPTLLCDRKPMAEQVWGWTGDRSWVWEHEAQTAGGGWLLRRWEGLPIDYGYLVRTCDLPDGTGTGFFHRRALDVRRREPWLLLPGAVWWSEKRMPAWAEAEGVVYPPDDFAQQRILDEVAALACRHGGVSGIARPIPPWWPGPGPTEAALAQGAALDGLQRGIQGVLDGVRVEVVAP
jgi:hypothetical protein